MRVAELNPKTQSLRPDYRFLAVALFLPCNTSLPIEPNRNSKVIALTSLWCPNLPAAFRTAAASASVSVRSRGVTEPHSRSTTETSVSKLCTKTNLGLVCEICCLVGLSLWRKRVASARKYQSRTTRASKVENLCGECCIQSARAVY